MSKKKIKEELEFRSIWFGFGEIGILNKGTRMIRELEVPDREFIGLALFDKWMWSKWTGFEKITQEVNG